jgi:hypothetical protein
METLATFCLLVISTLVSVSFGGGACEWKNSEHSKSVHDHR